MVGGRVVGDRGIEGDKEVADVVGCSDGKRSVLELPCKGSVGDTDCVEDLDKVCPCPLVAFPAALFAARLEVESLRPRSLPTGLPARLSTCPLRWPLPVIGIADPPELVLDNSSTSAAAFDPLKAMCCPSLRPIQ